MERGGVEGGVESAEGTDAGKGTHGDKTRVLEKDKSINSRPSSAGLSHGLCLLWLHFLSNSMTLNTLYNFSVPNT